MEEVKRSFDIINYHSNQNINYFVNISKSVQLVSPGLLPKHKDLMKMTCKMISYKLLQGEVPLFKLEDEKIKDLLLYTKNNPHYENMPFKEMFIDIVQEFLPGRGLKGHIDDNTCIEDLPLEEQKKYEDGSPKATSCIMRGIYILDVGDYEKPYISITCPIEIVFTTRDGEKYSMNAMWDTNIGQALEKNTLPLITEADKNKIKEFICNILDFINHPDVELVCNEKHNRNDLRIKRGLKALPSRYSLVLQGKLKKYINDTISNNEKAWELGHRFWVRGHWMEFKDECYKNMKGKKKWILPYIKGKGELINKTYYVGEKEQCWENQKRMVELVQNIFPDKKIEKNDRTTLNGLEIDCYIPELKLGFEYNGQQHYEHIEVFHKTKEDFEAQLERDKEKIRRASEKGIKIIVIRYDEQLNEELIRSKL